MDWITLVVVVLAVLVVVGVAVLLRRWPVSNKRRLSAQDRAALADQQTKSAEAHSMTEAVRNPFRW